MAPGGRAVAALIPAQSATDLRDGTLRRYLEQALPDTLPPTER